MTNDKIETTFYRFYSEIRSFLSKLITSPIKAQPSNYLKERGFYRKKIIDLLIKKNVLERKESIKDKNDTEELQSPTYFVKYKVRKKDFEKKIHRIYSKYFEKNTIEEDGATGCCSIGSFNDISQPLFGGTPIKKNINEEIKKVIFTEEQFRYIQDTINTLNKSDIDEETTTFNIGSCGNYTANGLILKDKNGKKDPSYNR